jgi:pimeloyl-ACP methyl ester carboxylesterase
LQLPALSAAGFRPIAPDTPGFGQSRYDGAGWSFRRMAAHMAALLEELGAGPAHVVGLSMGGVIAQQLALDFPHLVCKLVLVSTFSFLQPDNLSGWIYFMRRALLVSTLGLPAQARLVARRVFPAEEHAPLRDMLVDTISRADPRAYRRAMLSLGTFDSRKRLREIRQPSLVVTGAVDTTVLPVRQKMLAQSIPGAAHQVIQQAGHAVPVDQAEIFNQVLLEFLKA